MKRRTWKTDILAQFNIFTDFSLQEPENLSNATDVVVSLQHELWPDQLVQVPTKSIENGTISFVFRAEQQLMPGRWKAIIDYNVESKTIVSRRVSAWLVDLVQMSNEQCNVTAEQTTIIINGYVLVE